MKPSYEERNKRLLELFELTGQDMELNRHDSISPEQFDRIVQQLAVVWRRLSYLFLVMIVPPIVIAIFVPNSIVQFVTIMLAISSIYFFVRSVLQLRPQQIAVRQDITNNAVSSVDGRAIKSLENEREFYIGVGDLRFLVQQQIYDLIEADSPIAIYYLSNSKKLLSIEYLTPFIEENMTM